MKKIIDISQHNGQINFEKVKNDGIDGVIIRVGWIGNKQNHTLDTRFEENYIQAKQVGLKVGFYVYSYCKSQTAIASGTQWFLNKIINKNNIKCLEPTHIKVIDTINSYYYLYLISFTLQMKLLNSFYDFL